MGDKGDKGAIFLPHLPHLAFCLLPFAFCLLPYALLHRKHELFQQTLIIPAIVVPTHTPQTPYKPKFRR